MEATAVIIEKPGTLSVGPVSVMDPGAGDVVIASRFSGISTGTERLLWEGKMPEFPGMGYPLVPGYETVGEIVEADSQSGFAPGQTVFVPGSSGYRDVRGLFGGAASQLVTQADRIIAVEGCRQEEATLFALAATAYHAVTLSGGELPDLIVGNGVLGRLAVRIIKALGGPAPVVWEVDPARRESRDGTEVVDPEVPDERRFRSVLDVSGDSGIINQVVPALAPGGEIILAGFYPTNISFAFPPVFMKEARFRVSAEWQRADLVAIRRLVAQGRLDLGGLVTHSHCAFEAAQAYETAFSRPECLKMILDWRECA